MVTNALCSSALVCYFKLSETINQITYINMHVCRHTYIVFYIHIYILCSICFKVMLSLDNLTYVQWEVTGCCKNYSI